MPEDDGIPDSSREEPASGTEEGRSLLSHASEDNDDEAVTDTLDLNINPTTRVSRFPRPHLPAAPKRQSSLSLPPPNGQPRTPRTPNRVRFADLVDERDSPGHDERAIRSTSGSPNWLDEDDYLHNNGHASTGQRAPLLTDITPPSSSPFRAEAFHPEDYLPNARPKSGMHNAFMNMANSIIGAGIIGQPYAFRQAGLTMAILLLVGLTITVDWTIRLIVINSKLSGADSFQATMQHCFGQSGLIAISVAQWAFAFGGMVAFCVIIGDTIPHVLAAVIPGLEDMSFLWLLTDRRAVIMLFVLGISWPLSLYRDIAKVCHMLPIHWS